MYGRGRGRASFGNYEKFGDNFIRRGTNNRKGYPQRGNYVRQNFRTDNNFNTTPFIAPEWRNNDFNQHSQYWLNNVRRRGYDHTPKRYDRTRDYQQVESEKSLDEVADQSKPVPSEETVLAALKVQDGGKYTDDEEEQQVNYLSAPYTLAIEKLEIITCITDNNSNFESLKPKPVDVDIDQQVHVCFGKKELSDFKVVCGSMIFHVHEQLALNYVSNVDDLIQGKVQDDGAMRKIWEILYTHSLSDETFLICDKDDPDMNIFWDNSNRLMHAANRLGISVVKTYLDRALLVHRCDASMKCPSCWKHRRLFATIFDMKMTKASFVESSDAPNLDDVITEMLRSPEQMINFVENS